MKIKDSNKKPEDYGSEGIGLRENIFASGDPSLEKTASNRAFIDEGSSSDNGLIKPAALYEKFITRAQEVREMIKNGHSMAPSAILSDLHNVLDRGLVDRLYNHIMTAERTSEDLIIHTVDVTFTCLKLGMGLGYDTRALLKLGLAAFLENVGMHKIPDEILESPKQLNYMEMELIKKHPEMSHDILSDIGKKYNWLVDISLQVHERSDGSGYPKGLTGAEILEPASIIGLVDTFAAMIKPRPYRKKFLRTEAARAIIETGKGLFPLKILKAFLIHITLFPINSFVKLNNGFIGRVTVPDRNHPLRPAIEILHDESGNRLTRPWVMRLSENPLLFIEAGVDPEKLI